MDPQHRVQGLLATRAVHALERPRVVDRTETAEDVEAAPRALGRDRAVAGDDRATLEADDRRAGVLRSDRLAQGVDGRRYRGGRTEEVTREVELVDQLGHGDPASRNLPVPPPRRACALRRPARRRRLGRPPVAGVAAEAAGEEGAQIAAVA